MPILISDLVNYKRKIFIETGLSVGSGIKKAIAAGFKKIYSIEIDKEFYNKGIDKFYNNKSVNILFGDSSKMFPKLMNDIKEPATIWLDSHTPHTTTLIEELKTLIKHPIKTHTILIDDIRKVRKGDWEGITMELITKLIKEINPKYKISFIDGYTSDRTFKKDILVAK